MNRPRKLLCVSVCLGCAAPTKLTWRPDELRSELRQRAPSIPADQLVVPFEISPSLATQARRIAGSASSDSEKVRLLTRAMLDPAAFGLRYAAGPTAGAEETLRRGAGNCMALASVFIGLARAAGLEANYIDASSRIHETRQGGDGLTISEGHLTAVAHTERGDVGLDFGQMGPMRWYRVMSDLEAVAHFYNNHGFDSIDGQDAESDWKNAAGSFEIAVQLMPGFAPAWNNLGIAEARLGRPVQAAADYRAAIAAAPKLAAPRNNLGTLLLSTGDPAAAVQAFERAAQLEPDASHIEYNLALALLRLGDTAAARRALERAMALHGGSGNAQALLASLPSASAPP